MNPSCLHPRLLSLCRRCPDIAAGNRNRFIQRAVCTRHFTASTSSCTHRSLPIIAGTTDLTFSSAVDAPRPSGRCESASATNIERLRCNQNFGADNRLRIFDNRSRVRRAAKQELLMLVFLVTFGRADSSHWLDYIALCSRARVRYPILWITAKPVLMPGSVAIMFLGNPVSCRPDRSADYYGDHRLRSGRSSPTREGPSLARRIVR